MDILSSNFPHSKLSPEQIEKIRIQFWQKVDKSGDCWIWTGSAHRSGYGLFCVTPIKLRANRAAWELTYGVIPDGLYICHRCNNPRCVRPEHLYAGTPQENMDDKVRANHHLNVPKGENTVTSKLSASQVQVIREKYRNRNMIIREVTFRSLAKEYGVSYETIHLIISNQTWK